MLSTLAERPVSYDQWDQVHDLELSCPCPGGLMDLVCTDPGTSLKLCPYAREKCDSCCLSIYGF